MRFRIVLSLCCAAFVVVVYGMVHAAGPPACAGETSDSSRVSRSICVRPRDLALRSASSATTSGLQDMCLLDCSGLDDPRVGFTHARRMKIIRQTYAPGGTHDPHSHESAEQAYSVLEGRARVRVADEVFDVEAGTMIYIPPKTEHQLTNIGEGRLVNLLIDVKLDHSESE